MILPLPAVALLGAGLLLPGVHAAEAGSGWTAGADLRISYFVSERITRDGSERTESDLLARARTWLQRDLAQDWRFRTRLAGSFSRDGNEAGLKMERFRATPTGTLPGEVHIDEFYLHHTRADSAHDVRIGRFQTAFNLPIVPGKSLDRNDSSNVGIGWTDGIHWRTRLGERWAGHVIGQLNHRRGAGNTVRPPLDFSDSRSRLGTYLAISAVDNPGPLVMRMFSLAWIPDALAVEGTASDRREDYVTASAKLAAAWPMGEQGMRLVLAGELAHAFNRPERQVLSLPGEGEVSGNAFQLSANLFEIRPGHHFGAVYGRVGGGWLISNDYRNNDELFELRYQRRFAPNLSMEIRYRWRRELERRLGAGRLQVDEDVYARVTWRM